MWRNNGPQGLSVNLALFSVLLAVMLWFQVSSVQGATKVREFTVPIDYKGVDSSLIALTVTDFVRVIAEGPTSLVDPLELEDISAVVDLSSKKEGSYTVEITLNQINDMVQLILPKKTVTVDLQRRTERLLGVAVEVRGSIPDGLRYAGAAVEPSNIRISGPARDVAAVSKVRVLLDLDTVRPGDRQTLDLEVLGKSGDPLPLAIAEPRTVSVIPKVEAAQTLNRVYISPQFSGSLPANYVVETSKVTPQWVDVRGESATLAKHSTIFTREINLEGLKADREFEVEAVLPEGLKAVNVKGESYVPVVKVQVKIRKRS